MVHVVLRPKAAMMSCGFRSLWRGLVKTNAMAGAPKVWDYDQLVMPIVCVCGTDVYVGAGCVRENRGGCETNATRGGLLCGWVRCDAA